MGGSIFNSDKYSFDVDEWSLQNENTNTTCVPLEWEDTCATNATNPSFFGDFEQARECQSDHSNASDDEDSDELRCKSIPKKNVIRGSETKNAAFIQETLKLESCLFDLICVGSTSQEELLSL